MLNVISGLLSGAGAPASTNSYESIATVTIGTAQSTITFSSIPSTFKHLQVRGILQISGGDTEAKLTLNGDSTSSNYATHQLLGDGSTAASYATANSGFIKTGINNSASGSNFGAMVVDILDYANTSKNKTVRTLTGADTNGGGYIRFASGFWNSTAATTSLTFTASSGNFNQYSSFALYGIKG